MQANTFFNISLKILVSKCHKTLKQIAMGSPLGTANYICLVWGSASLKKLGNTAIGIGDKRFLARLMLVLMFSGKFSINATSYSLVIQWAYQH